MPSGVRSRLAVATVAWLVSVPGGAGTTAAGTYDLLAARAPARPGDTVGVPPGHHHGPILIDRPLTVIGEPGAIVDGGRSGDVIRVTAPDVTVKGLTVRGTGTSLDRENAGMTVLAPRARLLGNVLEDVLFGIYLKKAPDSEIRGNTIRGKDLPLGRRGDAVRIWYSERCRIEENVVEDSRDVVIWFSKDVTLRGNRVSGCRYGLHFMYSDDNRLESNHLEGNSVGAFLMYSRNLQVRHNRLLRNRGPSGYGLGLKDMDGVVAEDNLIAGNRIGVYLDNSPWSLDVFGYFRRNLIAFNDIGFEFQPSVKRNLLSENTFMENLEQVAVRGTGTLEGNSFTPDGRGNYWSDYAGFDLDSDGIGDLPFRPASLFENLMDREPKLRLLLFSPVQQAIELAARAVPVFKPEPKIEDSAPLMRPLPAPSPLDGGGPRWPMGAAAAALMLSSLAVVMTARAGARAATAADAGDSAPSGTGHATPADRARGPLVEVRGLAKRYGRFAAVDDLSFDVAAGEAVALWGENGAGKTTALKCVLGLHGYRGRIVVGGLDQRADGKGVRRLLGYVPQELALYDDMTAADALSFFARIKRVEQPRVSRVLALVGLTEHARKRVASLSGGMKQRLALAAALLADPPLLLLDEVSSSLDAAARAGLLGLLRGLKEQGKSILFTSHRLAEVEGLADRVLVLQSGRLMTETTPRELTELLGIEARVRLVVEAGVVERALAVLGESGFAAVRNGRGIRVVVPPLEKAAPVRALLAAGVEVRDFDVEEEEGTGGMGGGRRGRAAGEPGRVEAE